MACQPGAGAHCSLGGSQCSVKGMRLTMLGHTSNFPPPKRMVKCAPLRRRLTHVQAHTLAQAPSHRTPTCTVPVSMASEMRMALLMSCVKTQPCRKGSGEGSPGHASRSSPGWELQHCSRNLADCTMHPSTHPPIHPSIHSNHPPTFLWFHPSSTPAPPRSLQPGR